MESQSRHSLMPGFFYSGQCFRETSLLSRAFCLFLGIIPLSEYDTLFIHHLPMQVGIYVKALCGCSLSFVLGKHLGTELQGVVVNVTFNFIRNYQLVFSCGRSFLYYHQQCVKVPVSHVCPNWYTCS